MNNFWDKIHTQNRPIGIKKSDYDKFFSKEFLKMLRPAHKKILDLGCGNGLLSVFLAQNHGQVLAVDSSAQAISATSAIAKANRLTRKIKTKVLDADKLDRLETKFDLVCGQYILHHLSGFDLFCRKLQKIIKPKGKAIFYENNANNRLLMAMRPLAGKFGIRKFGQSDEHPLDKNRILILKKYFSVKQIFPNFVFFSLIGSYLLPENSKITGKIWGGLKKMDKYIFNTWPNLRKYSYHQIIILIPKKVPYHE